MDYNPNNDRGDPVDTSRCREAVQDTGRWSWRFYQCLRKARHGNYCWQHAAEHRAQADKGRAGSAPESVPSN